MAPPRRAELFTRLAKAEHGTAVWQTLRDELVRRHLPLVHFLVRRFRGRGEPLDDLVQVATIGLIKAVDRFDPERGIEFSTYATPTVVGEVKRHFRDRGWAIRVPRRLQENMLTVTRVERGAVRRSCPGRRRSPSSLPAAR